MKATFSKIQKIFLSLFLYIELVVFLALSYTIIYCHCFKISPTITEALSAFGIHLVYSTVAVALPFELFYFYCYSKKQTEELREEVKNELRISNFKTKRMINEVKCVNKKYTINGLYGKIYSLTAKQLCERVLEDSKSDYNWIAPARELIRVCKEPSFPDKYAIPVKIAILNCFANIEHRASCGDDRYITNHKDAKAVQYCYNYLHNVNTIGAVFARKRYLTEMIAYVSDVRSYDSLYPPGPTFMKLLDDWRKSKFEEYSSYEKIDFKQLVEKLRGNFSELIKDAEANGVFEEDERKNREELAAFATKVFKHLDDI